MMLCVSIFSVFLVGTEATPRIVSVPDLHGDYERAVQILQAAGLIDRRTLAWSGGSAVLVQTGDIADRGDKSLEIYRLFARLAREAPKAGGSVINLLGNHELMNIQGDDSYISATDMQTYGGPSQWQQTWRADGEVGQQVRKFKAVAKVGNVLFSHAGILPKFLSGGHSLDDMNKDITAALSGGGNLRRSHELLGQNGPLWTRFYAEGDDNPNACAAVIELLKLVDCVRMIVGHTIQERSPGEFRVHSVCKGTLILADTAISSAYGGEMSFIEYHANNSADAHYPGLNGLTEALPPSALSATRLLIPNDAPSQMDMQAPRNAHASPASVNAPPKVVQVEETLWARLARFFPRGVLISVTMLVVLILCVAFTRRPSLSSSKLRYP